MAVYLRSPPASEGRQCQRGSQSSPPEADQSTAAAAAWGLGYLNLPMAHFPGLGGRWEM